MEKQDHVVGGLNTLLADATVFYQKLRHYHWNVAGRKFFELHQKFEELYTAWATVIDEVAERVLTVEAVPLHTLASMLEATRLEEDASIPDAAVMVERIRADLTSMHAFAGTVIEAAEEADDRGTANLLDDVRDTIEKDLWMLRAWSEEAQKAWG